MNYRNVYFMFEEIFLRKQNVLSTNLITASIKYTAHRCCFSIFHSLIFTGVIHLHLLAILIHKVRKSTAGEIFHLLTLIFL